MLYDAWNTPGRQSVYIGLDNPWLNDNIFKKYIDRRTFWQDYPEDILEVKDTQKEAYMHNNPPGYAPHRMNFLGFFTEKGTVGSSYDNFYISETGLYPPGAFDTSTPIWEQKLRRGEPLYVEPNGTPRGTRGNMYYDLLRYLTGEEDPEAFPGEHGNCYVDLVTIDDVVVPDKENGGFKPLYTEEDKEKLQSRMMQRFGNLNLYRQEYYCDFLTVNAGLVYQGIETLEKEGRYTKVNLDSTKPVYVAWDVASMDRGKGSSVLDSTAAIVFQYYNGKFFLYDYLEVRGLPFLACVNELAKRDYFHLIKMMILPWDLGVSKTVLSPIDEARRAFPNITLWHELGQEAVARGVSYAQELLPNMMINSDKCEYVLSCFQNYSYRRNDKLDTWNKPQHNWASHMMDAFRYAATGCKEVDYLKINAGMSRATEDIRFTWEDPLDNPKQEPSKIWHPREKRKETQEYDW
jgi:hypothetical protein